MELSSFGRVEPLSGAESIGRDETLVGVESRGRVEIFVEVGSRGRVEILVGVESRGGVEILVVWDTCQGRGPAFKPHNWDTYHELVDYVIYLFLVVF